MRPDDISEGFGPAGTNGPSLIERLRALSRHEHSDYSIGDEAADALEAAREDAERYRWLRDSKACSMSVSFNDHHNMYQSVTDTLDEPHGYYSDISDSERGDMISSDTIWTVHVYPNSPVGFNVYHAATLDAAIDAAREVHND